MRGLLTIIALCWAGIPALSQPIEVSHCDWESSARNLGEPWEAFTRTFSNGKTRLAMLDTIEPAAGAVRMLVLSPPYDELGSRQCRTLGINGMGFAGMDFDQLSASYDPATGLDFTVPIQVWTSENDSYGPGTLWFRLNQATGEITGHVN
jgi:hypothetical protein